MRDYKGVLFGGLALAAALTAVLLGREADEVGRYTELYNVQWACDPTPMAILPLALPASRWNAFGKVMGTSVTTAVSYDVRTIGGTNTVLVLGSEHQRCPALATCTLDTTKTWNVFPSLHLSNVVGADSTIDLDLPAATDTVVLSNWHGLTTLVLGAAPQAQAVERQLWSFELDNIPSLTAVTPRDASSASLLPVDARGTLDTLRLTPHLLDPATVLSTSTLGHQHFLEGEDVTFALIEPVCATPNAVVSVADIVYLGRVGAPRACTGG